MDIKFINGFVLLDELYPQLIGYVYETHGFLKRHNNFPLQTGL
jgi:hypothetical protein